MQQLHSSTLPYTLLHHTKAQQPAMYFPSMKSSVARLFLAAYTLLHSKSILVTAGLCELNSDICSATTGTYTDHDNNSREWWAFIPQGSLACREEGCPLYIWIDGTNQAPYQEKPDQLYMLEMLKRRFIAVNVAYDASTFDYPSGRYHTLCY
jgi:hypothetical protein